jgi:gliding motility-associated-like protein
VVLLCCLVSGSILKAQQGNIWYFGNFAGLSFNTSPPTALPDGNLNTQEGASSICDADGNLLFYTNGRTVFNRIHDPMVNGLNLSGHISSYQSSIIVPKPGSSTIYYIFTSDAWESNGSAGYCYSEVDMSLDNGLGAVTSNKNVFLAGPSSERLAAIRASDNNSYWVITNLWGTNIFHSYKVDCNGVNTTPVVSTLGKTMTEHTYCNIGTLRVSPNGKLIIQTNVKGRLEANPTNEYAQLFDFDDATGILSNDRVITLTSDGYYFGAEFSPDSKLLYIVNPLKTAVHQFDVTSGNAATILASKVIIPGDGSMAGISMGADQKLYLTTGASRLHVINQPNVPGLGCNLGISQVSLTGSSILTLPNIIPNLYTNRPLDFTFQLASGCTGSVQFNASVHIPGVVLSWDFGDGNIATGGSPSHTYTNPGQEYVVKLTATNSSNCVYEVVSRRVRPAGEQVAAGFGYTINCDARRITFTDSAKSSGTITYLWQFGDGNTSASAAPTYQFAAEGVYTIRQTVTSSSGCVSDTKDVTIDLRKPVVNAGPDVDISTIGPIQLNATGAVTYQWKPSLYLDNPNIANPVMRARDAITYVVTGTNAAGCTDTDTLQVTVKTVEMIEMPNAFNPSGTKNPVLRPVIRLATGLNYFKVYNRWGQMIFSTNTIGHGWDGTYNGLPQPTGTYVWMLEAIDSRGNIVRKQGTAVLIR